MATAKKAAQAKAKAGEAEDAASADEAQDEDVEEKQDAPKDDEKQDRGSDAGDLDFSVKKDKITATVARDGNAADTFRRLADLVDGWDG